VHREQRRKAGINLKGGTQAALDNLAKTDTFVRSKDWLSNQMSATEDSVEKCTSNIWFTCSKKFHSTEKVVTVRTSNYELPEVVAILSFLRAAALTYAVQDAHGELIERDNELYKVVHFVDFVDAVGPAAANPTASYLSTL
jgi:hypothetical protein